MWTRHWRDAAAVVAIAAAVVVARSSLTRLAADPDLHFHLAISRDTAREGLVRAVPQVAGLGWDQGFPEKEFLFHQLTGLGYRLGGEEGTLVVAGLLSAAAFLALYALCRRYASPAHSLGWVAAVALLNGFFLYRMLLVRPHVLAVLAVELMLWGILSRRRALTAGAGALFTLGYHTLYIPLGFLAAAFAVAAWRRDRRALAALGFGLLGLAAGILANPYFPTNVMMSWTSTQIALNASSRASFGLGVELMPLRAPVFLLWFGAPLALCGLSALFARRISDPDRRDPAAWLGACAVVLWVLAARNPRAIEYAIPVTCLFAALALPWARPWPWLAVAGLVVCDAVGLRGLDTWGVDEKFQAGTDRAVGHLPPDAAGHLVFNCAFEQGAYLLHRRPDVRFVDLSDPHLLFFHSPARFEARERFKRGEVADAWELLHEGFGADYVLCGNPEATQMLDSDPRFLRLYPAPPAPPGADLGPAVYALGPQMDHPARVGVGLASPPTPLALRALKPSDVPIARQLPAQAYLNLAELLEASPGKVECARVSVPPDELARHPGTDVLGVGGGPLLSVWANDVRLLETGPRSTAHALQTLIALPHPITASDTLEVLSCAPPHSAFWSVSLSFWNLERLRHECEVRGRPVESCFVQLVRP